MTLNRKQKQMAGVLAILVLALVCDRLFVLEKPNSADAATTDGLGDDMAVAPTTQKADKPIRWGSRTGSARLLAATRVRTKDLAGTRDIFQPQVEQVAAKVTQVNSSNPTYDAAAAFVADHKLTAIFRNGRSSVAIVGDRMVHIGEGVAGFRLVALEAKAAVFERPGVRVRLILSGADGDLSEVK